MSDLPPGENSNNFDKNFNVNYDTPGYKNNLTQKKNSNVELNEIKIQDNFWNQVDKNINNNNINNNNVNENINNQPRVENNFPKYEDIISKKDSCEEEFRINSNQPINQNQNPNTNNDNKTTINNNINLNANNNNLTVETKPSILHVQNNNNINNNNQSNLPNIQQNSNNNQIPNINPIQNNPNNNNYNQSNKNIQQNLLYNYYSQNPNTNPIQNNPSSNNYNIQQNSNNPYSNHQNNNPIQNNNISNNNYNKSNVQQNSNNPYGQIPNTNPIQNNNNTNYNANNKVSNNQIGIDQSAYLGASTYDLDSIYKSIPVQVSCPNCKRTVLTNVVVNGNIANIIYYWVMCCCFSAGLCWCMFQLCRNKDISCNDYHHYCGNCGCLLYTNYSL